jgi:hypothetical protein
VREKSVFGEKSPGRFLTGGLVVITMKKITSFYQNRTSFYLLEMFCKFCDIIGGIARGAFMEQNITKGKGTAAVKLVFQLTPAYEQLRLFSTMISHSL